MSAREHITLQPRKKAISRQRFPDDVAMEAWFRVCDCGRGLARLKSGSNGAFDSGSRFNIGCLIVTIL